MNNSINLIDGELPDGFSLEHDTVQPEAWAKIEQWLSSNMLPPVPLPNADSITNNGLIHAPIPWETGSHSQGRKVAQFGNCKYDYVADEAIPCDPSINPIPDYIRHSLLCEASSSSSSNDGEKYTQCIINMYEADNLIPWHLDHMYFGPEVLVYTFGEVRPLLLRKPVGADASSIEGAISNSDQAKTTNGSNQNADYIHSQAFPRHCSKYLLSGPAREVWEHSVPSGEGKRVSITFRSWIGPK